MKNVLKYIIFSISVVLLVNYNYRWKLSLFSFILGISIYFLIKNFKKEKFNILIFLNSFLYALFLDIGISYQKGGTLSYLWKNFSNIFISLLNIIVFTYLFYMFISFLCKKIKNLKNKNINNKIIKFIFDDHSFISSFIITLSISLFYLIFFYPGCMSYDGLWQLDVYKGITIIALNHPPIIGFTNHHPAVITLIMGYLMDIGTNLLNNNLGMFLYILLEIIINALVYAYVLKIMQKMNVNIYIRIISLLFYSLFPFLVINSITYIKDTIFYLLFLFIFVYIYYHFRVNYQRSKSKYIVLMLLYILIYLTRNTAFYILLISSFCLVLYYLKKDKYISIGFSFLIIILLGTNTIYNKVFLVKMDIKPGSIREMLSIPLQQTGRYLKYYKDDLSKSEKEVLESIFDTDLETIGKVYYPNKSDNVKWHFKEYPTSEELKEYLKVWFKMFFKHPFTYIDATLNNTYGYIYPNEMNFLGEEIGFYYINVEGPVNTKEFNLHWNKLDKGRNILKGMAKNLSKTKGLRLLYMPGFYVWLLIFACFYLLNIKKVKVLIYFMPLFMVVITCFISPVNAHMRYLEPVLVSMPFIFAILNYESKRVQKLG